MNSQQQAAELYREIQDASAEAWAGAATHTTAYMHSAQADEDAEQLAAIAPWYPAHPNALYGRALLLRWLARLGLLCLFGVGLALALTPLYLYRQSGDGRWMAVSMAGALIVSLVYQAARRGRK